MRFWEIGRTIICVGRNYAAHARELNNPVPAEPFFFLKPVSAYVQPPGAIELPYEGADVHHEGRCASRPPRVPPSCWY